MYSQQATIYVDKTFGGSEHEIHPKIYKINQNSYIIVGNSTTNNNGDKTDTLCNPMAISELDIWLAGIDSTFNISWNKSIGGANSELGVTIVIDTLHGCMYLCSHSNSDSSCEKSSNSYNSSEDYWVIKTDLVGNKIWDKVFGGGSSDTNPQIIELMSGELIIYGRSVSQISFDKTEDHLGMGDYWLIKIDTAGNKVWDKVIGGTGSDLISSFSRDANIIPVNNEDCILCGSTSSPISGTITNPQIGSFDVLINKIDSIGNIEWEKRLGGVGNDRCNKIIQSYDNGFIILGQTSSLQGFDISDPPLGGNDIWILSLDSLGNKIWDKRYGGSGHDYATWIDTAPGSGYFIAGSTSSNDFDVSQPGFGLLDFWFFKIDSIGNKLWDVRFGGPGADETYNFLIQPDSSIILFGQADSGTSATKTDPGKGKSDYWLVHFKYDETTGIDEPVSSQNISVSPNPSTGLLQIPSNLFGSQLAISDLAGRVVFLVKNVKDLSVDLSFFPQGSYLLNFQLNQRHYRAKWIRME